jgi:hypothetical protein
MNREQAIDIMFGHAKSAAQSAGVIAVWSNIAGEQPTEQNWCQPYAKHVDGKQSGFTARGKRRYRQIGVLWIKIYVLVGDGTTNHVPITQKFLDYFQKLRISNISYVNIRAVEDKAHGRFFVTDFMADFSYDVFN